MTIFINIDYDYIAKMIRKITSKQDEEKKSRRNQIIVGIVLVVLMLFSILGYSFGTNSGTNTSQIIKYNGYEFTNSGGLWNLNIGGTIFSFVSHPKDAYKTDSSLKSLTSYYGKPLYLYSESQDAESEIYRNLYSVSQKIEYACPTGEICDAGVQEKACADNFIIIREKDNTRISQDEGCIFIEGSQEDLAKIVDGFLLKIMGVN